MKETESAIKTVLVVDDEYALVEALRELLEEEGYRVVSAANGKDGLARLEKEKPDLVIVDYMMPISDGRELVLKMHAKPDYRSIPVVMMSAAHKGSAMSNGQGGTLEVSAFLSKPFRVEKVLEVVTRLIGKGDRDH